MRRLVSMLALCLATGLAGGCGQDEPQTVTGDDYSFEVPAGWDDITGDREKAAGLFGQLSGPVAAEYDASVVSGQSSARRQTSFSVRVDHNMPPGLDSKRLVEQSVAVFENPDQVAGLLGGLYEIDYPERRPQRTELGGETAYEILYSVTSPEAVVKVLQIYAVHRGSAYVATLRAAPGVFDPDAPAVTRILETWKWE